MSESELYNLQTFIKIVLSGFFVARIVLSHLFTALYNTDFAVISLFKSYDYLIFRTRYCPIRLFRFRVTKQNNRLVYLRRFIVFVYIVFSDVIIR